MRGAYIINIFFFATCGTKIRRIFENSFYVILGGIFGSLRSPKIHTGGAYIINEVKSPLVVQR